MHTACQYCLFINKESCTKDYRKCNKYSERWKGRIVLGSTLLGSKHLDKDRSLEQLEK